ncbi:hypothetical protein [Micromonospora sp. S-DT3-3-22]|uniref:hypothetical protein n=1 Tax=Micromonospora sp. S-DT3-3-22 TaxID=2755359 RepID=UPI00188F4E3C|nr:hypothetical protein [Micromonospora sp. S-DT3-3-22]
MRRLTDNTVVRHPETGEPVLLAAGGSLPDWATDLVGDHLLDGAGRPAPSAPGESREQQRARLLAQLAELDGDEPGDADADAGQGRGDDGPPPKGGAGSGAPAWREYADRRGVEVPADASREAVIEALDAADVPTE